MQIGRIAVLTLSGAILAGCVSSGPPPGIGFVLMVAVDAGGSVAYKVMERGFPTMQACERRMHAVENSRDIVLRCVAAKEAL